METEFCFKIVLIGDSGVGKTSIIKWYTDGIFTSTISNTIGVDFRTKSLQIGRSNVQLQLWDTAGQERFAPITANYFRTANAIVLVYDIGSAESFENLQKWLFDIERYEEATRTRMLIGNKTDRTDRVITEQQGREFAQMNDMLFLETSAKNSDNIDELFTQLAKTLYESHKSHKSHRVTDNREQQAGDHNGGCC